MKNNTNKASLTSHKPAPSTLITDLFGKNYTLTKGQKYVNYKGEDMGVTFASKYSFYKVLIEKFNIDWRDYVSRRLIPDECFINENTKTLHVFEKKTQNCSGSVDEKLQTSDFKKKEFQKLMVSTGYKVEYTYVLGDWFNKTTYRDVLKYIKDSGCQYFFGVLPVSEIDRIFAK